MNEWPGGFYFFVIRGLGLTVPPMRDSFYLCIEHGESNIEHFFD